MDDVTLPRSFEDTTPAEMMKDLSKKRSPSQSPILDERRQPRNYSSINPSTSQAERIPAPTEQLSESDIEAEDTVEEEEPREWLGKRIWVVIWKWERDNLELVLENKQSVARDHLGMLEQSLSHSSQRTNLFSLATDIPLICINWSCNFTTVSAVYYHSTWKPTQRICSTAQSW
jgi:hypothetical protein